MTETQTPLNVLRPEAVQGALNRLGEDRTAQGRGANEQDWHFHAANYIAGGMPPVTVAEMCGVHVNSVYTIQQSSEFQERVRRIQKELDKDVMELFKKGSLRAAMKLIELSETAKSESVQLAATESILDRHLGKPTQFVVSDNTVRSDDPVKEGEALRREIQSLQQRN